jgi:hypothetical protein
MSRDHGVVHQPHLPENDGGDRTAILASSWRGNARAVTPKKGPYPFFTCRERGLMAKKPKSLSDSRNQCRDAAMQLAGAATL